MKLYMSERLYLGEMAQIGMNETKKKNKKLKVSSQ